MLELGPKKRRFPPSQTNIFQEGGGQFQARRRQYDGGGDHGDAIWMKGFEICRERCCTPKFISYFFGFCILLYKLVPIEGGSSFFNHPPLISTHWAQVVPILIHILPLQMRDQSTTAGELGLVKLVLKPGLECKFSEPYWPIQYCQPVVSRLCRKPIPYFGCREQTGLASYQTGLHAENVALLQN
ncbi:hypothetical protein C8R45DRAFT_942376 [Mycena sanguinolenta]|nr:hypothetical protein C8R45DRAFT_942376 [Mycena sanguinolenta]